MSLYHSRIQARQAFLPTQCGTNGGSPKISEIEGTGVLHTEADQFGPVRYIISCGFDDDGQAVFVGLLKAHVHVIAATVSARKCLIVDDRNGRRMEIIITRHELGANEADIMLIGVDAEAVRGPLLLGAALKGAKRSVA